MAQVLSPGSVKPTLWRWRPERVAPEWRPYLKNLRHAAVFHDAERPVDFIGHEPGTVGSSRMSMLRGVAGTAPLGTASTTNQYLGIKYPDTGVNTMTVLVVFEKTGTSDSYGVACTAFNNSTGYRMRIQSAGQWRWRIADADNNTDVNITSDEGLYFWYGRVLIGTETSTGIWNLTNGNNGTNSKGIGTPNMGSDAGELRVGADSVDDASDIAFHAIYEWRRYLTDAELRRLREVDMFGPYRPISRIMVRVPAAVLTSNDRLADMAFCRGRAPFGPGRLPIPDGTID